MAAEWYIRFQGKDYGPASLAQLCKLVEQGKLVRSTLLRRGLEGAWMPAEKLAGLFPDAKTAKPATATASKSGVRHAPAVEAPELEPDASLESKYGPLSDALGEPLVRRTHPAGPLATPSSSGPAGFPAARSASGRASALSNPRLWIGIGLGCVFAAIVIAIVAFGGGDSSTAKKDNQATKGTSTSGATGSSGTGGSRRNPPPPPVPESEWKDPASPVVEREVKVTVVSTAIDRVPLLDGNNNNAKQLSPDSYLIIRLQVQNVSREKPLEYNSWSGLNDFVGKVGAELRDDSGKEHDQVRFDPGVEIEGQLRYETLGPGKTVDDVVVFEVPPPAEFFRLELPTAAIGGAKTGKIRFKIPAANIQRK